MGLEKNTNGYANPVDEENYRRTSNFLLISRLTTNVPVRSSRGGVENSVDSFVSCLAQAENKAWYLNFNKNVWEEL